MAERIIVPTEKELSIEDRAKCPVRDCGKEFKSSTCLLMHQKRHHEGQNISSVVPDNHVRKLYYCPVEGCNRGPTRGRPFPRLGQLKQHYNGVHGNKSYECDRCGLKFGLKDVYKRHAKECGEVFQCAICNEQFKSSNALYQHNKRKHKVTRTNHKATPPPIVVSPIVIKPLIQLPIRSPHSDAVALSGSVDRVEQDCQTCFTSYDLATQTDLTCAVDNLLDPSVYDHTHSYTRSHTFDTSEQVYNTTTSCDNHMYNVGTSCDNHMYDAGTSCDFGTQTATYDEQWIQDPNPMGYLQYSDFGTQTLESAFDDIACLDFGTQTIFRTKDQGSQT